jgi:hypothetical protein
MIIIVITINKTILTNKHKHDIHLQISVKFIFLYIFYNIDDQKKNYSEAEFNF